uniref:adenosylmethionine decarboxylase n=1 Tax=Dunaliella tertiolecta TaxID=3047 RepID=A0A7S3RAB7_DUNTE|mmetsp:Transcript_21470/g.59462  ORF Transcript_21470/g.59462 Transcript_21470/m.59462 type:complete len:378 (+) Transcript_21470:398-1531(+)|eukprot:CAMPEP_0202348344 /NCGR_PEP_ID=MMETSP1126-20121109/6313_1 /ASSEMBLY_ACC=CAM_ASM_000457 /TAXON_ID=3047 /ORGANISM="Dunaliella tertiolecta, Strain CCMP1320" /LENGTH=377 /DNA_ID=CAMNT_0048940015 /DNA_START=371 /DNA_END=1504 /DNA_ORIENTATION=+
MDHVHPAPVFEGSEKRVEIDFAIKEGAPAHGLRALPRAQLDELMTLAACTIVSSRSNADFDAYVLSESSLFVYPTKWVLKTCGTTRLLRSVPRLLELAAAAGLAPARCKYNRASFLFPEQQPAPHTGFDAEVEFLDKHLAGHLDVASRQARVIGSPYEGLQWHVYVATSPRDVPLRPTFNVEVCMTELGEEAAQQFFRTEKFVSAADTTRDTGIVHLKPGALIDDYVFEPCGYSMNGISKTGFITIHVTPEKTCSYASVEVSGYLEDMVEPSMLVAQAMRIFRPGKAVLAITTDGASTELCKLRKVPFGYNCPSISNTQLAGRGSVFFCALDEGESQSPPCSPMQGAMSHGTSSRSLNASCASDSEPDLEGTMSVLG